MIWVLIVLTALFVLAALRMRARLAALDALPPSDAPPAATHRFFTAPGVTLDDATRRAASAWATAHGKEVVDLIPGDLPTIAAMSLAQIVDPATYAGDRLAVGRTAGHAILVTDEVATRAAISAPADEVAMIKLAAQLKTFATATSALVLAPAERARPEVLGRRRAVYGHARGRPVQADRGNHGRRGPVSPGGVVVHALAPLGPPAQTGHVRLGTRFIAVQVFQLHRFIARIAQGAVAVLPAGIF